MGVWMLMRRRGWGALVRSVVVGAMAGLGAGGVFGQTQPVEAASLLSEQPVVEVESFDFEGNAQLSDAALMAAIDAALPGWRDRLLAMEDLETARQAVTRAYIQAGYISSGAVIPDQSVADGRIVMRIVEGRLTAVRVSGNQRLRDGYISTRVMPRGDEALNLVSLRDRLELLRQDPTISQVNADLQPGLAPGEAVLDVSVQERSPYYLALGFNNYRSPTIGAERLELLAAHRNLTGNGDELSLRYAVTQGGLDELELACFDDFGVTYVLPLNADQTTLSVQFVRSDELVIEAPFNDLDIQSRTEAFDLTLRHPVHRTPNAELAIFATGSVRRNRTKLNGQPFSFSPGAEDGKSDITAIRFGAEWLARDARQALALRGTVSIGVHALGSTNNSGGVADSQFASFLGQAQYVRRLDDRDTQLLVRGAVQWSADPLMSIEQMPIGGFQTVRGYRENAIVRDNGAVASVELRVPVMRRGDKALVTMAPFFDIGYGWNDDGAPDYPLLSSVGVGAIFTPWDNLTASVYWGYPLNDLEDRHEDPQDLGFHFGVVWTVLD